METTRLQKWYNDQRAIDGHWAETDYELACSLSNGELESNDGLPDWLRYDEESNSIYDIDNPCIIIQFDDDYPSAIN